MTRLLSDIDHQTVCLQHTDGFLNVHLAFPENKKRPVDTNKIEENISEEWSLHCFERLYDRDGAHDDRRDKHTGP